MGLARMFVGFCRMLCGGSSIALPMMFGCHLMGFRSALVMFRRFLVRLF